jgi:hypothetical protein
MSTLLACPHCGSTDLVSYERITAGYPATFTADGPQYTGEESYVYDDGSVFEDDIGCQDCRTLDMRLAQLVPAVSVTENEETQ